MKYELLKELPGLEVGHIMIEKEWIYWLDTHNFANLLSNADWFKPIRLKTKKVKDSIRFYTCDFPNGDLVKNEKEKGHPVKEGEGCYHIHDSEEPMEDCYSDAYNGKADIGLYFINEKNAKDYRKFLKLYEKFKNVENIIPICTALLSTEEAKEVIANMDITKEQTEELELDGTLRMTRNQWKAFKQIVN